MSSPSCVYLLMIPTDMLLDCYFSFEAVANRVPFSDSALRVTLPSLLHHADDHIP